MTRRTDLGEFTSNMKIQMTISTKNYQVFGGHMMNFKTFFIFIKTTIFANITSFIKKLLSLKMGDSILIRHKSTLPVGITLSSPIFHSTFSTTILSNSLVISFSGDIKLFSTIKTFKPVNLFKSLLVSFNTLRPIKPRDFFNFDNLSLRFLSFVYH